MGEEEGEGATPPVREDFGWGWEPSLPSKDPRMWSRARGGPAVHSAPPVCPVRGEGEGKCKQEVLGAWEAASFSRFAIAIQCLWRLGSGFRVQGEGGPSKWIMCCGGWGRSPRRTTPAHPPEQPVRRQHMCEGTSWPVGRGPVGRGPVGREPIGRGCEGACPRCCAMRRWQ